jgi:MerR family redox-sensitive transcriptional activator SoxR
METEAESFRDKRLVVRNHRVANGSLAAGLNVVQFTGHESWNETARVSGRRLYDTDAIGRIDVLRFAQQAGFTLDEIKTLFHGFGAGTPLKTRWQSLARTKLQQLDLLAKRIQRMRRALELGLECGCIRVEDCTLSPADVPDENGERVKARCGGPC